MENEGMSKSQITLILGLVSLVVCCIPCVGSTLYMIAAVATFVFGFLAHSEAGQTGADTTMAKVGMGLALLPILAFVVFIALYICGIGGIVVLDNL
ncbi:MAG: hypothetical protein EP330_31150 [Deltaproteobacteria bacterium]|nr:MAG: hypothetical protein EP330_31150 [Deltaproteobacteria bacterium]